MDERTFVRIVEDTSTMTGSQRRVLYSVRPPMMDQCEPVLQTPSASASAAAVSGDMSATVAETTSARAAVPAST